MTSGRRQMSHIGNELLQRLRKQRAAWVASGAARGATFEENDAPLIVSGGDCDCDGSQVWSFSLIRVTLLFLASPIVSPSDSQKTSPCLMKLKPLDLFQQKATKEETQTNTGVCFSFVLLPLLLIGYSTFFFGETLP